MSELLPIQTSKYRPDIDGLRAIAVLSVIVFHINKSLLPGGFVGVDIFFVISGFLITSNILQEIKRGHFSIIEFYRRRVKRIAPAMLVVVFVTLFIAQLVMLPDDTKTTAKSAVWSLASLANVYFWLYQDTSYFAVSSQQQPLLHLWSLGVEEQFYILWPLLLLLVYRPGREKLLFLAALVVASISFLLGNLLFERDPSFVYYMLPTRAGELLLGALVAIAVLKGAEHKLPSIMIAPAAAVGALLLAGSLIFLSEDNQFPGLFAVPPTLGVALLIFAGHCRDNWISRLLTLKPLIWIGLISYSAYLWHWPLLAFFRYGYGDVGVLAGVALFSLTILLAWLTYLYVEQPMRRSTESAVQVFVRQFAAPAAIVFVMAWGAVYADRLWPNLFKNEYRRQLADLRDQTRPAYQFDYVCQRQKITVKDTLDEHCKLGDDSGSGPLALLWGDSNAAHYIGMIGTFARASGVRFRNLEIGSCPPIVGDPKPFVDAHRVSDCRESLDAMRPIINESQVVIISASWLSYQAKSAKFLETFFDTAREMAGRGKLVILIGKAPEMVGFDRLCREKALSFPFLDCPTINLPLSPDVANINEKLHQFAQRTANVQYFDATHYLCPDGICSTHGRDGEPLYYDQSHLSMSASWKLGDEILMMDGVPVVFKLIADWPGSF